MKSTAAFKEAYQQLNEEQRAAVDTLDGPVMVVAGPGTGKTQVIALRIANILMKTDTEPDAILALTFTESAAKEMRERLTRFIGHTAYYISISTFHSFCVDVIRENPDRFEIDPSEEPLSELDKLKLFRRFLNQGKWKAIRPVNSPYHYVRAGIAGIADLKREGIDSDRFEAVLAKESTELESERDELKKAELTKRVRDLAKNQELAKLYRLYQDELAESKRFDFEDMISHVTRAFRADPDLLLSYQERYQYFLVDEYQDTNSAQNQVVSLLAGFHGQRADVFVVGDPDQSIFRFQGASIENQLSFVHQFPGAAIVTLQQNYRSGQNILDSAHSLITNNELRINDVVAGLDPHLLAALVTEPGTIRSITASAPLTEDLYLVETIQGLLKRGVAPSEIVVIYRTNSEGQALGSTLAKFNLDYVVQGGGNILGEPVVQRLLKIFRVIDEMRRKEDDIHLFTILNYDIFGIDPLDVLKISRKASDLRATLFDVLSSSELLGELELTTLAKVEEVLASLAHWQDIDANSTFTQFFETVLTDSGYLKSVLDGPDMHNNISRLNTLFDEVKKMERVDLPRRQAGHHLDLQSFLANLDLMEENNLRIEEGSPKYRADAITLTTAHSAKGLEWEHVFLYRVYDGAWGNKRTSDLFRFPPALVPNTDLTKKEKNEDERRLFYVAVTRAKTHLYLTRAASYSLYGRSRQVIPSMFLYELGDVTDTPLTSASEAAMTALQEKLLSPTPVDKTRDDRAEADFLTGLVDKLALSVTALNAYLECPYKFKLDKLLRVPRAKLPHLAFGTAVHAALEAFYRELKDSGKRPPKDFLLNAFELALKKEILTLQEESTRLEQGRQILSAYYDFYRDEFVTPLFLEKFSRVHLDDIVLTGKIDRIDSMDGGDRSVRVVDYKTGKLKSMGQIMGTTEDSSGDLHRQLKFYKLLIDLDRRLKVNFGEAELDFVAAPDEKGKSGKLRFRVSEDEVKDLKTVIRQVMANIRALKFPRTTDLRVCAKCDFRDHCYPDGIPTNN